MDTRFLGIAAALAGICVAAWPGAHAQAALTPAQRKTLTVIRADVIRIKIPVKPEAIEDSQQKIADVEQQLDKLAKDAELGDDDPTLAPVRKLIAARRDAVAKANEKKTKESLKKTKSGGGRTETKTPDKPTSPAAPLAAPLAAPVDSAKKTPKEITVARPTGDETVSFKKDIAPFMVERCLRCHSGNDPRGGLSMETFEKLLVGGKSGSVIEPKNIDKSRIWDLVGKQRPFKMPPGDALVTRTHWSNLRKWIREGAAFDGGDPKAPLSSLVPTEADKRARELAGLTPEQFRDQRRTQSEALWRRVLSKESPQHVEQGEIVLYGNVAKERLEQTAGWADEAIRALQAYFDDRANPAFKGGLAVFVMKDRFSYDEFTQVVQKREPAAAVRGHAVVTPDFEDAYVVVQDLGDDPSGEVPSARANLVEHLTSAFLLRSDKTIPDWLVRGTGRVVPLSNQAPAPAKPPWLQVHRLVASLEKPEDVFTDGTFSPPATADVGAALVAYLLDERGKAKFVRFVKSVQNGASQSDAFRDVYAANLRDVARAFVMRVDEKARHASN